MRIYINEIKQIPSEVSNNVFGVCVYGEPTARLLEWINFHCFVTEKNGLYTNITVDKDLREVFIDDSISFDYLDGFSPNLNKHLHIGHASNLVLAKAFQSLGMAEKTIAILGDTLIEIDVTKMDAKNTFDDICKKFNYNIDKIYFGSKMKLIEDEYNSPEFIAGTGKNNTPCAIIEAIYHAV